MASRKQQKEEARQRRLEQERTQAAQAQRRRRMQMLAGVLVAAVAVIAVAIAISAGGGSAKAPKPGGNLPAVNHLLSGIPQSGTTLGNPHAKVTVEYYGDLECPICSDFTLGRQGGGFPQMVQNLVRTGKVKVVYRSLCTATCNDHSQSLFNQQQVAAYAAGKQNLFWDYADLFYHEQQLETSSYVTPAFLRGLAQQIPNLKMSSWQTDQKDPSLLAQVQADESKASQLGLSGTPTLVAIGSKGETVVNGGNFPTYSSIQQAVSKVS